MSKRESKQIWLALISELLREKPDNQKVKCLCGRLGILWEGDSLLLMERILALRDKDIRSTLLKMREASVE